jgi:hypothetical protein
MVRMAKARQTLEVLARDLERVFGARLQSLIAYESLTPESNLHSLAIVDGLTFQDLAACLPLADGWHRRGLEVPLMLSAGELKRTMDIFPLEYAGIIATHTVVRGRNPFDGMEIPPDDLRRGCEAQAKGHLIHLREAFLESHGETASIVRLIGASAAPFRALLTHIARLTDEEGRASFTDDDLTRFAETRIGIPAPVVRDVFAAVGQSSIADPTALLARYLEAAQRVWEYVDRWR